jgi:p-aminobenzoyl-glutamate transporter AbgT
MKVFVAAVAFAVVAAVAVAMVLNTIQEPSSVAFTTSGARVGDSGHNLIGPG